MLPPVEDAVLQHNPEFAILYKTLTTAILNPDCSTKHDPATKERTAVHEELKQQRKQAAKKHLLIDAISIITPTTPESKPVPSLARRSKPQQPPPSQTKLTDLPPPLLDLLLLLPVFLSQPTDLPPATASLLLNNPPFSSFPTYLSTLATLVSSSLHTSAIHLARIAAPTTNPSFIHRTIPSLPSHLTTLQDSINTHKATLSISRLCAATSLATLLQHQATALSYLLRSLESKHGPIARSLEFRATEISLTAQRQETEAEMALWQVRKDMYTEEVQRALRGYERHLRDAKGRLGEAVRVLEGELEGYGVGEGGQGYARKEKTMREMAKVYREMGRQVEEVRGDLERLGRA